MSLDNLKVNLQYFLPKHLISWGASVVANAKLGRCTTFAISRFAKFYHVNLEEMDGEIRDFETFNEFFSRPLKPNARPIDADGDSVVFPVDGKVSQFGDLRTELLLQAKGHYFSTETLLGDEADAKYFENGKFMTVYLSPSDYHRVHIPFAGRLLKMTYIPGELFSVNPLYTRNIPELLARNERVVCIFDTAIGKMAVIFVGAVVVGSVSTDWEGVVAPKNSLDMYVSTYEHENLEYDKGAEIGKFLMGSTVICLFEKDKVDFVSGLECEQITRVGTKMATAFGVEKTAPEKTKKTTAKVAAKTKTTVRKTKTAAKK